MPTEVIPIGTGAANSTDQVMIVTDGTYRSSL